MSEYTENDYKSALNTLQHELDSERTKSIDLHRSASISAGIQGKEQNLIEWQLDLSKELELIGHQLRGHVIEKQDDGSEKWGPPKKKVFVRNPDGSVKGYKLVIDLDRMLLNEKGAQEIEKIIRGYLNRNLLLSNFDEPTIKQRVEQFANRLRRFLFLNYEDFGLDTDYKQKHFEMLVMNITDMIESAYYRALHGGERESLRTARQVTQSEGFGKPGGILPGQSMTQQKGSMLNPVNWFGGKR